MTYSITCTVYTRYGCEVLADASEDFDTIVKARRFAFKELNKKRFNERFAIFSVNGSTRGFIRWNYKIKDFVYVPVSLQNGFSDKQYYLSSDGIVDKYREIFPNDRQKFTHWM